MRAARRLRLKRLTCAATKSGNTNRMKHILMVSIAAKLRWKCANVLRYRIASVVYVELWWILRRCFSLLSEAKSGRMRCKSNTISIFSFVFIWLFEACGLDPRTKSTRKNEKTLLAVLKAKGFASGPPTRINGKVTATYLLRYKNLWIFKAAAFGFRLKTERPQAFYWFPMSVHSKECVVIIQHSFGVW